MQIFVIEAYGGPGRTDGTVKHFTVQADSPEEAVAIVQKSAHGSAFERFETVRFVAERTWPASRQARRRIAIGWM